MRMMTFVLPGMLALIFCLACGPRDQAPAATEAPGRDTAALRETDGTSLPSVGSDGSITNS